MDNYINFLLLLNRTTGGGIVYGEDRWVAVSYIGASDSVLYSLDNGVSWISTTAPSTASWSSITYGDGEFVAVGYGAERSMYSVDGINWSDGNGFT